MGHNTPVATTRHAIRRARAIIIVAIIIGRRIMDPLRMDRSHSRTVRAAWFATKIGVVPVTLLAT
jgi:hypothetical protein